MYQAKYFIDGNDTLRYRILLPENFNAKKKYPLVIFLHGAGERGSDNEKQLVHGARLFAREDVRKNFPAIVIFPQCPANDFWANYKFGMDSSGKRTFQVQPDKPATKSLQLVENLLAETMKKKCR